MQFEYSVRWYQRDFHEAILSDSVKKAIAIWHRRAGKDDVVMHGTRDLMLRRAGTYWHCLPEYAQARKALWDAVDAHTGRRRIETAFPPEAGFKQDQQKMMVTAPNGATWQLIGSDNYDATVGAGPVCIAYSEWALANPSAYAYHKPMLRESGGKALFITTPRGNNHAKRMFDTATGPDWFRQLLSARDTLALTDEELAEELVEYQSLWGKDFGRAYFEQEYLCSWAGAQIGAYFAGEMSDAEREGRIRPVEIDRRYPVHTVWDLGKASNNPIWCFQVIPGEAHPLRIVDFYTPESDDIQDWAKVLLDERGYDGYAYVPHDIMATEWGRGRTRLELIKAAGFKPRRLPMVSVEDGRQAGRIAINSAVFDPEFCELGIEGLKAYRREWDDKMKTFRDNPVKDWAEHIGSAWRYVGLAWYEQRDALPKKKPPSPQQFKVVDGKLQGSTSIQEAIDAMIARKKRARNQA